MNVEFIKKKYPVFLLCLLVGATFFLNLHKAPLFDLDEGAFSEATREMFERHDFLSTYLDGIPRYDKPILVYWFQAVSVSIFGANEWAFRFPSGCFACFWMLSVYFFTARLFDRRTALAAACIATTSLGVIIIGRAATADALLNALIAPALFCCFFYFQTKEQRYLLFAALFTGLGFLTKGPIALIIPAGVTLIYSLFTRQFRDWYAIVLKPAPMLLFLALSLPWYCVQYFTNGNKFINGFFFGHNVNRYMSTMERHGGQFWYYVPVILLLVLPYTSLFVYTSASIKRSLQDRFELFAWIWFIVVFLFFSFSGTKLPHYLLYGCAPLFILMGLHRMAIRSGFVALAPFTGLLVLLLLMPFLIQKAIPFITDAYLKSVLSFSMTGFTGNYFISLGTALMVVIGLLFIKKISPFRKLFCAGVLQVFLVIYILTPVAGTLMQEPVKEAALFAKEHNLSVVSWGMLNPSFSVYRGMVTPRREPGINDVVFTSANRLSDLKYRGDILFSKGGIVLVKILPEKANKQ